MNRTLILIAVAAVVIAGVGIGLLLPALDSGPLAGSIAPTTTGLPLTDVTVMFTPTPTPVQPVSITVSGFYRPYRRSDGDWYWHLVSVTSYDATNLPAGVTLKRVDWAITATVDNGGEMVRTYLWTAVDEPPVPMIIDGRVAPGAVAEGIPLTDTTTLEDKDTFTGCSGADLCALDKMWFLPPFKASCTIRASDGTSYTRTVTMSQVSSWI